MLAFAAGVPVVAALTRPLTETALLYLMFGTTSFAGSAFLITIELVACTK